jgi:hypothetical protein
MRFACVYCFSIEADDPAKADRVLADLQQRINGATGRLAIGYRPGFIKGQPQLALVNAEEDHE